MNKWGPETIYQKWKRNSIGLIWEQLSKTKIKKCEKCIRNNRKKKWDCVIWSRVLCPTSRYLGYIYLILIFLNYPWECWMSISSSYPFNIVIFFNVVFFILLFNYCSVIMTDQVCIHVINNYFIVAETMFSPSVCGGDLKTVCFCNVNEEEGWHSHFGPSDLPMFSDARLSRMVWCSLCWILQFSTGL